MSLTHDRKFLVAFDLLVGILVGLFAGTVLLVGFLAGRG
jgi:hypothetical protein